MVSDIIRPEPERSHLDDIGPDTPTADLAKNLRFVAKWTLNPPHPVPLQEAARRLDRLGDLEAIVRDLAEGRDPAPRAHGYYCTLCARESNDHADTCPYRRAREWVAGHG